MINQSVFINEAMDNALENYIKSFKIGQRISAVDFLLNVIDLLMDIYDKEKLINVYNQGNEAEFNKILLQFGLPTEELNNFYKTTLEFYHWNNSAFIKTTLINDIQKTIIKMIKLKNETVNLSDNEIRDYEQKLYIKGTNGLYNKINSVNPDEIFMIWEETKAEMSNNKLKDISIPKFSKAETFSQEEFQITVNHKRPNLLENDKYESFGLTIEEVKKLDDSQIENINNRILQLELNNSESSGGIVNQKEAKEKQKVLTPQNISGGGGFVDRLLLLGIMATISMIAYVTYVYFRG